MRLALVFVLLLPVLVSPVASADPQYAKVGFEIEIGAIYVFRYDGEEFTNVYEKTPGSYLARTRGIVADNPSKAWPLLQLTADNVDEPSSFKPVLRQRFGDPDGTPVSKSKAYRGVLEIVTGPLLHNRALQEDVLNAARLFVSTLYDACNSGKQSASNYYALQPLLDEYNSKLSKADYDTTHNKALLELRRMGQNTAYVSCPGPEYAANLRDVNLGIDIQATFGTPLRTLKGSADAIDTWPTPNDTELAALRAALGNASLPEVLQHEFEGIVRLWYPLMHCAMHPNKDGARKTRIAVLCDKKFAKPLPHVDACALADRFWQNVPDAPAARRALNGPLTDMAKRLLNTGDPASLIKLGLPPSSDDMDSRTRMRNETRALTQIAGTVLRGTEICAEFLEGSPGKYLAFADATIIAPLELRVAGAAPLRGFGLEIRNFPAIGAEFTDTEALLDLVENELRRYFGASANALLAAPAGLPPILEIEQ